MKGMIRSLLIRWSKSARALETRNVNALLSAYLPCLKETQYADRQRRAKPKDIFEHCKSKQRQSKNHLAGYHKHIHSSRTHLMSQYSHHPRRDSTDSLPSSRLSIPAGSPTAAETNQYAASTHATNISTKLRNGERIWTMTKAWSPCAKPYRLREQGQDEGDDGPEAIQKGQYDTRSRKICQDLNRLLLLCPPLIVFVVVVVGISQTYGVAHVRLPLCAPSRTARSLFRIPFGASGRRRLLLGYAALF